ncbi:MAG TPA: D-alanyl-D-alanine carboxypeptidase/D-alanyl-D-alanine-endopeptidase [Gemmatimonadales bacterium]|nr:D-alanyl-D-alanine carboxypeptidase/D-alanyl-D-alanine-endopeptidase [Gemmatimonadales bacterium]
MQRVLLAAFLLAPLPLAAQGDVVARVDAWYQSTQRRAPGTWGVVVADQTGRVLWSVNATEPMTPASTVKLLTTGFARTVVGANARRATRVVGSGGVDPTTGTWVGRWSLELNGDPTLERPDRAGPTLASLAEQLAAIGVRRLTGPLSLSTQVGDPVATYPTAWDGRHRGRSFAPLVGPVTLNENLVAFTVAPGSNVKQKPYVAGDAPRGAGRLVSITARTVVGTRSRLTVRSDGKGGWVVGGTIGTRAAPRRYVFTAPNPARVVEAAWTDALARSGIEWAKGPSIGAVGAPTPRVLAEVVSMPFDSIAHEVNTRSLNIGAELMLLWGGGADRAAERLTQHVRTVTGLSGDLVHLEDGSGLSDRDRVAPLAFTTYLARFPETAAGRDFPLLLPANGSGTLRRLGRGMEAGSVRAKTGTLARVSSLVGYLGHSSGMLLVAAMYNGPRAGDARVAQWELFRALGANGVAIPPTPADDADALGGPVLQ